MSFVSYVTK
jgi:hypothetical protein